MKNSYVEAMPYEFFIRRAFDCDYNAHQSKNVHFKNLIDTENGADLRSFVGSYEKQLTLIKKNIDKAIQKLLKKKLTQEERSGLEVLKEQLPRLSRTKDLLILLENGLQITDRLK